MTCIYYVNRMHDKIQLLAQLTLLSDADDLVSTI